MRLTYKWNNGPIKCSSRKYWNLTNRKLVCNTKLHLLKSSFRTKITFKPQVLSNTKGFDHYCPVQRNDRSRVFQEVIDGKGTFHQLWPVLSCSGQHSWINQPQIQHRNFCKDQQSVFWESNLQPGGSGLETRHKRGPKYTFLEVPGCPCIEWFPLLHCHSSLRKGIKIFNHSWAKFHLQLVTRVQEMKRQNHLLLIKVKKKMEK